MCIYVYTYTCVYVTYIYMYIHICANIYIYTYIRKDVQLKKDVYYTTAATRRPNPQSPGSNRQVK